VLVTTVNAHGWVNIAPKSWVSFVSGKPFRLVLGCHREHHTAINLFANGECVLNLPSDDTVQKVWNAQTPLPPAPDEPQARGFATIPAMKVKPPRLVECRAHMECLMENVLTFGDELAFILKVTAASVDESVFDADDPMVDLRPMFYVSPSTFGVIERGRRV
jgi:flavin reductase (DIM6/NTAB) family NADH-FMN oxidoreductase RutF